MPCNVLQCFPQFSDLNQIGHVLDVVLPFQPLTSSKVRICCKLGKSASSVHTLQWSNHGIFISLYLISNKVKDGTSDWLQTVLNHQSQLPNEPLHGSLCPILLNMAGPIKLVLANLEGLTLLLDLLTNHFQPVYS